MGHPSFSKRRAVRDGAIRVDRDLNEFLRHSGARVGDREAAGWRGDNFEVCAIGRAAFGIRDQGLGAVVGGVGALGGVKHVKVFEAGAVVDGLPCLGHSGFVRAVVHYGHARMNRIDEGAGVGEIHTVMVDKIEINRRNGVVGADECDLFGARQVA